MSAGYDARGSLPTHPVVHALGGSSEGRMAKLLCLCGHPHPVSDFLDTNLFEGCLIHVHEILAVDVVF